MASLETSGRTCVARAKAASDAPCRSPTRRGKCAAWLAERGDRPTDPLFSTRTGRRLSRDAIEQRVATHAATATRTCPSLAGKQVHPHVLRRSCAMALLQAGVDTTVIALWLDHADVRSTQPYLPADLPMTAEAAATFFQVVTRRYEHGSILLTTNRHIADWGQIFDDTTVAVAILDRLTPRHRRLDQRRFLPNARPPRRHRRTPTRDDRWGKTMITPGDFA